MRIGLREIDVKYKYHEKKRDILKLFPMISL